MINSFEDMNKASKEAMDNGMKAAAVLSKGMQTVAAETTEFAKKSFEDGTKTFEKLLAVKTIDKAFEIQTEYAKSAYEAMVAQSTKITELLTSVAKDAYKPYEASVASLAPKAAK
jgi:phasin family protein